MAIGITGANNGYSRKVADERFIQATGDTVSGNLTVTGTLSTTLLEALSANITVIDIKQYELSGFNVQGNATVQGSVSATGSGSFGNVSIADTTLASSGGLSGSALNIAQTWNTNLAPTALSVNVTDLSSNAASLLMDLRVGGVSRFNVTKSGRVLGAQSANNSTPTFSFVGAETTGFSVVSNQIYFVRNGTPEAKIAGGLTQSSDNPIRWAANTIDSSGDLFLWRDAAGTLAQRNGLNAQESRIYSTYTDASNYERFFIKTNVGSTSATQIGLSAAGSGQNRDLEFVVGGSTRMEISSGGNVGIGTTSPNEKLTVVGNISATGNVNINGHLAASTKSFKIPHQTKSGYLQYGVVESNEHGVYVRGKTSDEIITLPYHWEWLVDEDSVTVQVTPIGKPMNLWIVEQNNKTVKVGGVEGSYNYTIYGTRKDVPKLQIETEN
jgi:hypothetical protein